MKIYQVGGSIRDELLGRTPKDKDYVVVGATVEEFLARFPDAKKVGADFPVFIVDGEEYAFARKERKAGIGHKRFEVQADPGVSLIEDLYRRDFTINTFARDIETGELFYVGSAKKDLKDKILRHTSGAFREDPLRVYRAARFAATLNFAVHPDTLKLMESMKDELNALSSERVYMELERALMHGERPSFFFDVLRDARVLDVHFPEIDRMIKVPAGLGKHPETQTVYDHTMHELDSVQSFPARVMALCHDIGKIVTPSEILPHHYEHEKRGLEVAQKFFDRLKAPNKFRRPARLAIAEHMKAHTLDPNFGGMRAGKAVLFLMKVNAGGYAEPFFEFMVVDGMRKQLAEKLVYVTKELAATKLPEKYWGIKGPRAGEILLNVRVQRYKELMAGETQEEGGSTMSEKQENPGRITIVVSKLCPHCQELIEKIIAQEGVDTGGQKLEVIELLTDEGGKIALEHNLTEVPVAISPEGVQCEIRYVSGKVEVVCPKTEEK